jgi:NAD(P)-dependent dehydrogenase (short-subunit alcohol dehydrogenase family)
MSGRFAGKSVFVTGGARGIGAAIAGAFAAEGAVVTVADKDEDAAIETAGRIGPSALGLGCNVTSRAAVAEAMAEAERNWGGIDVLFNNAGLHTRRYNSPVTQVSEELWAEMLQVNLMGAVNCATVAAPMLARRGGGAGFLAPPRRRDPQQQFGVGDRRPHGLRHYQAGATRPDRRAGPRACGAGNSGERDRTGSDPDRYDHGRSGGGGRGQLR